MNRRVVLSTFAAAAIAIGVGCARNPVTGKSELSLISESQEIQMGQQAAQQTIQSIGLVKDERIQQYVSGLAMQIAKRSERPNLPWEFHVLDDPTVNAFALPGGFIFVTRGIMTYMNNEAELVGVLGHEIGHVTAKHSVAQISKAQAAQLGLGIGSILSSEIASLAGFASQGLGLLFLKYGRDDEKQADELGFRYMVADGYNPRHMATLFETLERVSKLAGAGDLPEWASTHPAPENRVKATLARLDSLKTDPAKLQANREQYLRTVRGLTFGDDPRQGYFEGGVFYHPDLRFELTFPEGWKAQNTPEAVLALSPNQDAMIQLTGAGQEPPEQVAQKFFSQEGIRASGTSRTAINGLPAVSGYFEAQTEQGTVQGVASFLRYGNVTFQLLGYTAGGKLQQYDQTFRRSIGSFRELRDPAKLNVKANKVELVTLSREMSIEEFNRQYPSTIDVAEVAVINGAADPSARFPAGTVLKRVVKG